MICEIVLFHLSVLRPGPRVRVSKVVAVCMARGSHMYNSGMYVHALCSNVGYHISMVLVDLAIHAARRPPAILGFGLKRPRL